MSKDFYDLQNRCLMRMPNVDADLFAVLTNALARHLGFQPVFTPHPIYQDDTYVIDLEAFCQLFDVAAKRDLLQGWFPWAAGLYENIKGEQIDWPARGFPKVLPHGTPAPAIALNGES